METLRHRFEEYSHKLFHTKDHTSVMIEHKTALTIRGHWSRRSGMRHLENHRTAGSVILEVSPPRGAKRDEAVKKCGEKRHLRTISS